MFPPPITIATCTPSSVSDFMSSEYCERISGSRPKLLSPINDSPESLSRTRLYFGSMNGVAVFYLKDFRSEDRETVLSLNFDDLVTSCSNSLKLLLRRTLV